MKTLIITTMEKEANIIIELLSLRKSQDSQKISMLPDIPIFCREIDGHNIFLIQSGKDPIHEDVDSIGPLIQLAVFAALHELKPDIIINAGTAGAIYAAGGEKHKVYLATTAMGHDSHFPDSDEKHKRLTLGNYPVPDETNLAKSLGFDCASLSTTSSMLTTKEAALQLKDNKALLVDMEWKYIVYTILRYKKNNKDYTPQYMSIKISTDFIDQETCPQEQFEESMNDKSVLLKLAEACAKVIEKLCGLTFNNEKISTPKPPSMRAR